MVLEVIKNKKIEQLISRYNENKLSHVFLIETNNSDEVLKDLKEVIKYINCSKKYEDNCQKCNLCHLIDDNTLPTLSIIFPDGQFIKKTQMEDLKQLFSHKPYLAKYNVYIIAEAEKFNASSANTMLKFMEEPEDDIIGFLITNNKENVISTIKSRCEIIKANYNNDILYDGNQQIINEAVNYIYNSEIVKDKSIVFNKKIIENGWEKSQLMTFFKIILDFYINLLKEEVIYESLKSLKSLDKNLIIKRINLVNDIIDKLNYNININLLLDYYIFSLEDLS